MLTSTPPSLTPLSGPKPMSRPSSPVPGSTSTAPGLPAIPCVASWAAAGASAKTRRRANRATRCDGRFQEIGPRRQKLCHASARRFRQNANVAGVSSYPFLAKDATAVPLVQASWKGTCRENFNLCPGLAHCVRVGEPGGPISSRLCPTCARLKVGAGSRARLTAGPRGSWRPVPA